MHRSSSIEAVVVAGGRCVEPVAGVSLIVRAVEAVLGADVFTRVHVLVDGSLDAERVVAACAPLAVEVHPHAVQRAGDTKSDASDTLRAIAAAVDAVVVHDADRGLAPVTLVRAVVAGLAAGHDVVVPVLPLTDTVKVVDAGRVHATPDRDGLRVVQTPQGFRSAVLAAHPGPDPLRGVLGGPVAVHTVPGDPLAFAVRTEWDVRLAELLVDEGTAT